MEAWCAAGITAVRHEDCGPCTQLAVKMAERAGVSPAVLRAMISLVFAITAARIYPTVKYGLGHGKACMRLVQSRIATMLNAIDALDWSTVRAAFAATIAVDYTSLFGGNAERLAADTLLERWRGLLPGFEATQHLIGPVIVTESGGDMAVAETPVRGYHYVGAAEGGAVWMAAGRYRFAMERQAAEWKIGAITFQLAYQEGNLALPEIARARIAGGRARPFGGPSLPQCKSKLGA